MQYWHATHRQTDGHLATLYLVDHTSAPRRTTNFLYRDLCFYRPSGVLLVRPYLVERSSTLATALITDTRTVQVFAQGVIVCVTVTACTLVTVLCYLCILKCLFVIIIIMW